MPSGYIPIPSPPRGMRRSQVDDRGRLLLPPDCRRYLSALGESTVFVTSFDRQTVSIYPVSVWVNGVEPLFNQPVGDQQNPAEDLWLTASWLGQDSLIDAKGRILLSPELRKALNFDQQDVCLYHERGHFAVLTAVQFEARREKCGEQIEPQLAEMKRRGLP